MENNLVESLLYRDSAPFSTLLTERFNEHIELTHLSPNYIINFLLGLSVMLMSDDVRTKYGVQRVFFTNYDKDKVVRLVVLTDKKSPADPTVERRMKVRSFQIMGKWTKFDKMILSIEEMKIMRLLANGESSDLPQSFTEKVETFYKKEQNTEKINLDEYTVEHALYSIGREEMHKVSQLDTLTRVRLNVIENFNDPKLRKQLPTPLKASPLLAPSDPNKLELADPANTMVLLTEKKIIKWSTIENFEPNVLSASYKQYYEDNQFGQVDVENFGKFFTGDNSMAEIYNKISLTESPTAECGFAHGSLFFLSYSYPIYIEVRQSIATVLYEPGVDSDVNPTSEMTLLHKPKFTGSDHSLYKMPVVIFFPQHHAIVSTAADKVQSAMSITGEIGVISVKLRFNKMLASRVIETEKRQDFIDHIFKSIEDEILEPEHIASYITYELYRVRPALIKYKFSDRHYISRYLAGWIASSENKHSVSHLLLSKTGDIGSTKFLIKSTKVEEQPIEMEEYERNDDAMEHDDGDDDDEDDDHDNDDHDDDAMEHDDDDDDDDDDDEHDDDHDEDDYNYEDEEMDVVEEPEKNIKPPENVMVIVTEEPMSERHSPDSPSLEEPYMRFERLQNEDTLVLNIRQEYVHAKSDILAADVDADFTRFVVSVSFAKSEDVLSRHALFALPKVSLSSLAAPSEDAVLARFLKSGTYFASERKNYEAFLDGIFLDNRCWKSTTEKKTVHADLYYLRALQPQDTIVKTNFKEVSSDLPTEDFHRIAESANKELQQKTPKEKIFHVILDQKPDELSVEFLDNERLSTCASARSRTSILKPCEIDFEQLKSKDEKLIENAITPKAHRHLSKVLKISHFIMIGFMIRDAISDAANKHYGALALDLGFLLAPIFTPWLAAMTSAASSKLIGAGSKFAGYAMKSLSFGIKRAISIYVFADFVKNTIDYIQDTNNTDAEVGMAVNGAFLAIDLLTTAAEVMGVGATLGPIGEIGGVLLIIGLNVYQTVKQVEQIEQIIPLNHYEVINEGLRAFAHMNVEEYVGKLMYGKMFNSKLMQEAIDYLDRQNAIDTYITASADASGDHVHIHDETMIDMRTSSEQLVSRTSPGLDGSLPHRMRMACFVNIEKMEIEHKPNFFEIVVEFFHSDSITRYTPTCRNAFGVTSAKGLDKAALFKLGNKSDNVYGYTDKSNIFSMAGGSKNVIGGAKSDRFVFGAKAVTGFLDGQGGVDILDLSSFRPEKLLLERDVLEYTTNSVNGSLTIKNIEMIILPTCELISEVFIEGNIQRILTHDETHIHVKSINNLVLELSGIVHVTNYAESGMITYLIRQSDEEEANGTVLSISDETRIEHRIFLMANLWDIESKEYENEKVILHTTGDHLIFLCTSWGNLSNVEIIFKDGSMARSNTSTISHVTLTTNRTIEEIEHLYTDAVERLGILMTAYSSTDDQSVTISHTNIAGAKSLSISHVLHNAVDHGTHLMLNGGRYLIVIHPNARGGIEETTIKSRNVGNLTEVILDLSTVIEFHDTDNSFIQASAQLDNSTLDIEISLAKMDNSVSIIGHLFIQDILSDGFSDKISIRNYGEYKISLHGSNMLKPSAIKFGDSTDIVSLTPHNVEPFNEITIDTVAARLERYSINSTTLLLTNFRYNHKKRTEKMITIFIENFYTVKKMDTLQIYIGGRKLNLRKYKKTMAPDYDTLWMHIKEKIGSSWL